ncbi:MAG: elongation factor Ts, partial [Spirochaetales bacterium]|nr:elongation factor Ts [Spirochaetales bacterium]
MDIKASDVKNLRDMTGAGMMACKKALADANGDVQEALKLLKEKGLADAKKRAD